MLMESARSRDLSKVRRLPANGGWGYEDSTVQEWFKHVNRTPDGDVEVLNEQQTANGLVEMYTRYK